MLNAIAIYDDRFLLESTEPQKLKSAPEKNNFSLFSNTSNTSVADLDKSVSNYGKELKKNVILPVHTTNGEYHYLKWFTDERVIIAFSSKKKLENSEVGYLFHNIFQIHLSGDKMNVSLSDVISNPLGYTGRDIKIEKIKLALEEAKMEVIKSTEKMVIRGEKLTKLEADTIILKDHSAEFEERGAKLNESCCGMSKYFK